MASDFDDNTDAAFFDQLVNSDSDGDDDQRRAPAASAAADVSAGDLAALTLADQSGAAAAAEPPEPKADHQPQEPDHEEDTPALPQPVTEPLVEAESALVQPRTQAPEELLPDPDPNADDPAVPPEAGSPGSDKGVHTAVKQAQWNDFGPSAGADPFGDLLAGGVEDAFFDQGIQASVVGTSTDTAPDHSFSAAGPDANANSQLDSSTSAVGYGDHQTTNDAQSDSADPQYLETLYPGWKYDHATQQWYQVDALSEQHTAAETTASAAALTSDNAQQHQQQQTGASYLQNTSDNTAAWGQDGSSAAPAEYPPNMLFYAEYPGWYFDTNTQQWQSLESYQQGAVQASTAAATSDGLAGTGQSVPHYTEDSYTSSYGQQKQWQPDSLANSMHPDVSLGNSLLASSYGSNQQAENHGQQANAESLLQPSMNYQPHIKTFSPSTDQQTRSEGNQTSYEGWQPSASHHDAYESLEQPTNALNANVGYQTSHMGSAPYTGHQGAYQGFKPFAGNQSWYQGSEHSTIEEVGYKQVESSTGYQTSHMAYEPSTSDVNGSLNGLANPQNLVPKQGIYKTETQADSAAHMHPPNNYWSTQSSMDFSQQQPIGRNGSTQQFGFSPQEQRSSAGRPPHALVTFGFGGKLLVLKETSSITVNFDSGNQGNSGRTVSILYIPEIVADKIEHSSIPSGSSLGYFHALCRHPIPGPLVGGSAASKDVNKWLDDMIRGYESSVTEFQGEDVHKLLILLLKILCQHYGKLRSPFGSDPSQEGIDGPEMAVTKLFSSFKSNSSMEGYGAVVHCMKNLPSESQIQATAHAVQNLLVSGRRKEALQYAQEGQLWGPALILALQLGDKFYADTVKKMAHNHFVSGSPLRTLCLLIAGQPADVFNFENPASSGSLYTPHQPVEAAPKGMLDDWHENLAIITANRTKGDDLVITHLGDCLWKEKNEVASAHSCYLVAELNIDSYSESARMCLIGADHLRCPRTFTSPEAIQRTEVYEYAKVLGNSQYILLPFQPYKLIYAYMLAEVGKVSDSLRYCQASLKVLKASGRASELELWKQLFSTLEERIRTHQQGGYATNSAAGKIVANIFTSLDKSLSRMMLGQMGTQSAPLPQQTQVAANERDISFASPDSKVVNSQSLMSMSPLMSSASEQSMSEMTGNSSPGREAAHNRSISEPDFGRTPQQGVGSSKAQSKSGSSNSRFGWLVQKTMGLVSKSHRQAKLGEQNKFYYDEKLKRWVEEGAEVPAEEPPLPPPPTKASFQNSTPDSNLNGPPLVGGYNASGFAEAKTSHLGEPGSGMPPMPPTQNQFSARGRMAVRSRYVDTFNKGGGANAFGAATSYSKPAAPSMSPLSGAKFFVPTPAAVASEEAADSKVDAHSETAQQDEPSASSALEAAFSSPPQPVTMQSTIPRYPSTDNIQRYPSMDNIMTPSDNASSSLSRSRASSWSGTYPDQLSSAAVSRSPDGQTMQSPLMPGKRPPHSRSSSNSSVQFNGLGEGLHDVEL